MSTIEYSRGTGRRPGMMMSAYWSSPLTFSNLAKDSELQTITQMNQRMQETRVKAIQHCRLTLPLLQIGVIIKLRQEDETFNRLSGGVRDEIAGEEGKI